MDRVSPFLKSLICPLLSAAGSYLVGQVTVSACFCSAVLLPLLSNVFHLFSWLHHVGASFLCSARLWKEMKRVQSMKNILSLTKLLATWLVFLALYFHAHAVPYICHFSCQNMPFVCYECVRFIGPDFGQQFYSLKYLLASQKSPWFSINNKQNLHHFDHFFITWFSPLSNCVPIFY